MSAPLLFIGLPMIAAALLLILRRYVGFSSGLAAVLAAVLAWLALSLPLGESTTWLGGTQIDTTTTILGRALTIDNADRLALAFLFAQAALLFLLSGASQLGSLFLPAGMVILGLLSAALFIRPFVFAALFLQLAASMSVFMLAASHTSAGRQRAAPAALRYLVYTTLSMPFILLTGWLLEASLASPADQTFIRQSTLLLMFGFAALLAVAPFHSWLPGLAEHSPPMASAFTFTVIRMAILFLLLNFLSTYPWLGQNPMVYRALTLAGAGMALLGAVFVFGQRSFGRSMGYIMMIDFGAVMLGLGLGSTLGLQAALITLALRGVALPLWALGLSHLRLAAGGDHFDHLRGMGRRYPLAVAAVMVGMLSVVGFPLTAGFVGRWGLLYQLAPIHPTAALILLAGTVSAALLCARGLAAALAPAAPETAAPENRRTGRVEVAFYGLGFATVLVLGIFPQLLLPIIAATADAFMDFGR